MLDKKGIAVYLLITLVVSFVLEAVALAAPRLSLLAYLVILVPAGAAIAASRFSAGKGPHVALGDVPLSSAVRIAIGIPLAFVVVHFITTLLGATHPDWRIAETRRAVADAEGLAVAHAIYASLAGDPPGDWLSRDHRAWPDAVRAGLPRNRMGMAGLFVAAPYSSRQMESLRPDRRPLVAVFWSVPYIS